MYIIYMRRLLLNFYFAYIDVEKNQPTVQRTYSIFGKDIAILNISVIENKKHVGMLFR